MIFLLFLLFRPFHLTNGVHGRIPIFLPIYPLNYLKLHIGYIYIYIYSQGLPYDWIVAECRGLARIVYIYMKRAHS